MDFLKLTEEILSVDSILKLVSSEKCGAVSIFVGTTRDNFEGKEVKSLEYEAYESMALKVMKDMCTMIRSKWKDVHKIAIYHRLGLVPVLEASVVIAISSPHRVESQAAVQYCIDNLKVNYVKEDVFEDDDPVVISDPHMSQIKVPRSEMRERIKKFTDRKREQVNINNIQDFIMQRNDTDTSEDETNSCARVDAVLLKSKDSKSHYKVMRTENSWGPQTKVETAAPERERAKSEFDSDAPTGSMFGVEERISDVESKLNLVRPISIDVYDRLKKIEARLVELESLSPEYVRFWSKKRNYAGSDDSESEPPARRTKFSSDDIWRKMKDLEKT